MRAPQTGLYEIEIIPRYPGWCLGGCSRSRTTPLPPTQYSLSAKRKPAAGALGDLLLLLLISPFGPRGLWAASQAARDKINHSPLST